jgi:hypothetical protein
MDENEVMPQKPIWTFSRRLKICLAISGGVTIGVALIVRFIFGA